ncbi:MAG: hypothetical protein GMKNLPBB_01021 [Myxococcota bacterium]|nr:hypothetical protein [Myxococcota bacterium]
MSEQSYLKLKEFVERHPVAVRSAQPLKTGVEVGISFVGDNEKYHFRKEKDGGYLRRGPASDPDFSLIVPDAAVEEIGAMNTDDIGEFGIAFFKLVLTQEQARKIHVRIHAGVFSFLTHGYFGVLALGGGKVMKYLGGKGFGSLGAIKDAITKARGA